MAYTNEQILMEIRNIADRLRQSFLKRRQFVENSKISIGSVRYHFGTWNNAVKEAGLEIVDNRLVTIESNTIDDHSLLKDLLRLEHEHGKVTESLINYKGNYSTRPYKKRWKSISTAVHEAHALVELGILKIPITSNQDVFDNGQLSIINSISSSTNKIFHVPEKRASVKKRSVVGEPIDFRGMRFAPVNEQGVVYIFGMVSQELGFFVESVRVKYPDCEGKRCFDAKQNLWEHIYIEFEFKSSNFIEHGHKVDDCDVIVCWIHDWPDCPIEVLELREAIRVLPRTGPTRL